MVRQRKMISEHKMCINSLQEQALTKFRENSERKISYQRCFYFGKDAAKRYHISMEPALSKE